MLSVLATHLIGARVPLLRALFRLTTVAAVVALASGSTACWKVPANSWLLSRAAIAIEVLQPIAAVDSTREGISALTAQAADAIRTALALRR